MGEEGVVKVATLASMKLDMGNIIAKREEQYARNDESWLLVEKDASGEDSPLVVGDNRKVYGYDIVNEDGVWRLWSDVIMGDPGSDTEEGKREILDVAERLLAARNKADA